MFGSRRVARRTCAAHRPAREPPPLLSASASGAPPAAAPRHATARTHRQPAPAPGPATDALIPDPFGAVSYCCSPGRPNGAVPALSGPDVVSGLS